MAEVGLQSIAHTMSKVIQLYETKSSRHSVMIVGQTLSGKTVSWRVLMAVMTRLAKEGDQNYQIVKVFMQIRGCQRSLFSYLFQFFCLAFFFFKCPCYYELLCFTDEIWP